MNNKLTYKTYSLTLDVLIKKYLSFSVQSNIPINKYKISFPFLFLTPKFHKLPVKFRYICSNVNSIGNSFNRKFENMLKRILNILKFKYKDDNLFWIISSSFDIASIINSNTINTVSTYDFENLFTNIPVKTLKDVLLKILDLVLNDIDFEPVLFRKLCNFCLQNNYIYTGSKIYLQINGIGMGTSYSSSAANLFLFFYEFQYRNSALNDCNFLAYRYIDDLIVLNLTADFLEIANSIYPDCLKLKKTNNENFSADFLDLKISLGDNKYISVYDKRNSFNFNVNQFIHWSSNIHKHIYINIIIGQIYRYFKICNNKRLFQKELFCLCAKLYYNNCIPLRFIKKYSDFAKGLNIT